MRGIEEQHPLPHPKQQNVVGAAGVILVPLFPATEFPGKGGGNNPGLVCTGTLLSQP